MMEAELDDGTVLEFPEGTDPAVIQKVVKATIAQRADPRVPSKPMTNEGSTWGGVDQFASGVLQGTGDEIKAAVAAAKESLAGGLDFGNAYDQALSHYQGARKQYKEKAGGTATALDLAGQVAPWLAAAPLMAGPMAGASLGQKAMLGARQGAQAGAISGGLNAEGTVADRVVGSGLGLAAGAAGGAAMAPVAQGVGSLWKRHITDKIAKGEGMPANVYTLLQRALQGDDIAGAGGRKIAEGGEDAMLADAGQSAQNLLDHSIRQSGPGATLAAERVGGRVSKAAEKVKQTLDDTLGQPQGVKGAARDIAESTKANRKQLYDDAYDTAINYSSAEGRALEGMMERIPSRVMSDAVNEANEQMVAKGLPHMQIKINVADDGSYVLEEMMSVRQLDMIKRALGTMGAEAIDQFGRKTSKGNMYSDLARELKRRIEDLVPAYGTAVKAGGDKIERDMALKMGRDLMRPGTTREAVEEATKEMSDAARDEAKKGLRGYIDDTLANVKRTMTDPDVDGREAYKLLTDMSSRASREKARMVLGDDAANAMFSKLDEAVKAFELRASVARNSATHVRDVTDRAVRKQVEGGPFNKLREAEPLNAVKLIVKTVFGRSPEKLQKISDEMYRSLVDVLTREGPEGVVRALSGMGDVIGTRVRRAGDLALKLGAKPVAVTGTRLQQNLMER